MVSPAGASSKGSRTTCGSGTSPSTAYSTGRHALQVNTVVASDGERNTIVIHDLTTGERLGAPLTGHEDAVTTLGVTHLRGTPILVSAARDNANRVWDLAVRAAS
jgi:WD40 repeat protein